MIDEKRRPNKLTPASGPGARAAPRSCFPVISVLACLAAAPPAALAATAGALAATAGVSQTDPPTDSADASHPGLEEVVVTAEKRSSTVQKTPLSITAFTGAELQSQGISNMASLATEIPGISFKSSGPGQTEYEMRGLTSSGGESPTVGFYLDETAMTPPAMALNGKVVVDPDLFDLARVEVLRGPQGTLYGAGSMGGTIKLVTNQPDLRNYALSAEGVASGTDGGGFNRTENAMLNLPLWADTLALRLVVTDKRIDGWIDRDVLDPFPTEVNSGTQRGNVAAAPVAERFTDVNWETLHGGRAALLVKPTDALSITAGVMYQRIEQGGPNTIDSPPDNEVHYQPFDVAEPFQDTFNLDDLTVKYDFDAFQIVSATSNWTRQQNQTQDISEAMQDYIGGFFGSPAAFPFSTAAGGLGAGSISESDYTRQVSEELRVASTGDAALQWLVGGYYSSFHAVSHVYSYYEGFTALFGTDNLADNHRLLDVDQYALFGESSYQLPDHLKATVGARYFTYHSKSATSVSGVSANGTSQTLYGLASNSGGTPKFNLSYEPDGDLTVYATAAKGFRPGGPNSPIPAPCPTAPTQFGPDSVWSYELGEKAKFLDQRIAVNASVYYENWDGIQQEVAPPCGYKYSTNAGQAKIYGTELELAVRLTSQVTLTQNGGYTHATNSTTVPAAGVVAGDRLLDVPEVTANTSLSYARPIVSGFEFNSRITYSYVGSMQDITYARNTLPGYDLVNCRAGVSHDNWSTYVFVDNLTDRRALLSDTDAISANVPIFNRVTTNQPRTIGLDFNVSF